MRSTAARLKLKGIDGGFVKFVISFSLISCVCMRSRPLCHAVFDLYMGDQPVSRKAKRIAGESFQRLVEGQDGEYQPPRLQLVCDDSLGACKL